MARLFISPERTSPVSSDTEDQLTPGSSTAGSPTLPPETEKEKLSGNSASRQRFSIPALTTFMNGLVKATPSSSAASSLDSLPAHLAPVKKLAEKWQAQCTPEVLAQSLAAGGIRVAPGALETYHRQVNEFIVEAAHDKTFQDYIMGDEYHSGDLIAGHKNFVQFAPKDFHSKGAVKYVPANGDHGRSDGFIKTAKFGPDNKEAHLMVSASTGFGGGRYSPSWALDFVSAEAFAAVERTG